MPRITSSFDSGRISFPQLYLGVGLTTLGTLLLELSLTRIFSVVFFYHFAFLAISIALFGLGAGGVFSYVVTSPRGNIFSKLGTLAVFNSIAVLASLLVLLNVTGQPGAWTLAAVYFAAAVPFFFSGTIVSIAVAEAIERVDRVYFFDLLGAAAGCLALVPFLDYFGGPNTVLAASVFFAVSAAIWYNLARTLRGRVGAVALALCFVVLIAFNGRKHLIDVHYAKGRQIPNEAFVRWNSFSRIGLVRAEGAGAAIFIDADASTYIPSFKFDSLSARDREKLLHEGPGVPYLLRPGAKTLILGPGGGWDVARAIASGSEDITAVEINPIIARTIMQQRFPDWSGRLYFRPEVHLFVEDGRSFVRRSQDKFQVLQATLVDTWASTAAGAFALSENNLYTTDAFRDYLNHLTSDGLLAFTRWGFEPPRESLRLVSLAIRGLADVGEAQPATHIVVVRQDADKLAGWGAQDTVLIFRKPLAGDDLAAVRAKLAGTRLQVLYLPGQAVNNEFGRMLAARDPETFWGQYRFNVSPVSDDRPFFFYTVQPDDVWRFLKQTRDAADSKINQALPLLFELMGVSLLATAVVLALPPMLLRARLPREKGVRGLLLYFAFIGAGYIMIQVALIQKFVLFLGHPTYALTVIIFSMLISSGVGSYFSRRLISVRSDRHLAAALAGVAALVTGLAFVVQPVSALGVGWPLPSKIAVTAGLIAPAGFLMGMPFPIGLARLQVRFPQAVRWAWALNAAASVLGSASAIFLAIYLGLRATLLIGAVLYLCALAVVWLERKPVAVPVRESVTA
ncbi:MAG TPA: hypothetical protein VEV17_22790 [Bryobacteraceae bacterium]|nr:hypothetical protein [Bryobacteraceae bacterium]